MVDCCFVYFGLLGLFYIVISLGSLFACVLV